MEHSKDYVGSWKSSVFDLEIEVKKLENSEIIGVWLKNSVKKCIFNKKI